MAPSERKTELTEGLTKVYSNEDESEHGPATMQDCPSATNINSAGAKQATPCEESLKSASWIAKKSTTEQ